MNLLEETKSTLESAGKTTCEVLWVGSKDGKYAMSWAEFTLISNFEYDNGFGGQEIAKDLVVVGKDFWLERGDYDGSEWWNYNTLPAKETKVLNFNTVCNSGEWGSIEEMNRPGGKWGYLDNIL